MNFKETISKCSDCAGTGWIIRQIEGDDTRKGEGRICCRCNGTGKVNMKTSIIYCEPISIKIDNNYTEIKINCKCGRKLTLQFDPPLKGITKVMLLEKEK